MRSLSADIRRDIVIMVTSGENITMVARMFNVSRQTVYNILRSGGHSRKKIGDTVGDKSKIKKLSSEVMALIEYWVRDRDDMTLRRLQERLKAEVGISVSQVAIWKRMKAMKVEWKRGRRSSSRQYHAQAC